MSEKVRVEVKGEEDGEQIKEEAVIEEQESPAEPQEGEDDAASTHEDLEARLKEAERRADEYYDRLLRASAEFDNYKKRTTREMQDVVRYANEKLMRELLPVVDNLERAIESAGKESAGEDPLLQGVRLTLNEVEKILERHHVKAVQSLGQPFDPNFHQAMMQEETDDDPPNTVIREMQKGYVWHDRLLRPAMVVVSKAKQSENG